MKIKVKYVQPVESILIKLTDGTDYYWFANRYVKDKKEDGEAAIEWIEGKPYKVSVL